MTGLTYYPIYSGGFEAGVTNSTWSTYESADFTDMNTNTSVPSGKRFQCVTITNVGSVGLVFAFGNSSTIVQSGSASSGIRVAAGESYRIETLSLGGSIGVLNVGVRVDPRVDTAKVGANAAARVYVFGEFGNQ